MPRSHIRTLMFTLCISFMLLWMPAPHSQAIEVPLAGVSTYLQTNGPKAVFIDGDWYTNINNNGLGTGGGYHYIHIIIPCGWPTNTPIAIDLYSPEINTNPANILFDEVSGSAGTTTFELYPAGTNAGAEGAVIPLTQTTYAPINAVDTWKRFSLLSAPITCGSYLLRISTAVNDQNGWRLRVGTDDDNDPTNAPPTNSDNPDGIAGTNDEISIGLKQVSYQHDAGDVVANIQRCLTLYEYVEPGKAQIDFHNFDMDDNAPPSALNIVRYYAPSVAYDPLAPQSGGIAGTTSAATVWNTGTGTARNTGDVIVNPEPGWWKIVTCISDHNQYIQEGQFGTNAFYQQPPTPIMTIAKDDSKTTVSTNESLTYVITYANTSNTTPTPGAATNVIIQDTIPTNTTYVSCAIDAPATGTCSFANGIVTYSLNGSVNAGATGSVRTTVTVNANATGNVVNTVTLDYQDSIGNPFPRQSASDTDTLNPTAITLSSFIAKATQAGVDIQWTTGLELNTLGFHIYRSTDGNRSAAQRLTAALIQAQGGGVYNWLDSSADPDTRYSYWLEEVELNGSTHSYGPAWINDLAADYKLYLSLIVR